MNLFEVSDFTLRFFPHRARLMAARRLQQGRWDAAFNLADSDEVVSAVLLNRHLMSKEHGAQQLKKAITRADESFVAPGAPLRHCLRQYQSELQALSEDLPGEEPWTLYRGYNADWADVRNGFWTLSREVANFYATRLKGGRLVKTEATSDEVVFYHNEGDEQVVVAVLNENHPVEEIPTAESDFVPILFTEAMAD